ncbi:Hypothetical predicted protein, partial [Mytilus galloprovincialis]
ACALEAGAREVVTLEYGRGWCVTKKGGSWYGKIRLKEPHPYYHLNNIDQHFSQAHQDETVYQISGKKNGFFVEMGAFNGQTYSNTLWLERKHNWTGLLIEANPDLCRQIDALKRQAWRLCACISDTLNKTEFIQSGAVGGMASELDDDQMKMVKTKRTISVPCFNMIEILDLIGVQHIDYFSLDVEGSEMIILESIRNELISGKIVVNIWSIEYRTWDGKQNIINKSFQKLQNLRDFFENIGGYLEHSQLNNEDGDNRDGYTFNVVYVATRILCTPLKFLVKNYTNLHDDNACMM